MATPKTCRVEGYLEHVGQSIGNFQRLYAHYKQERGSRWKTYRCEQKALHKVRKVVLGDPQAKREEVVVAYGAAKFGQRGMKGMRSVPSDKIRKHIERCATVVPVDEFRTSRVCSKCSEQRLKERGRSEGGKEDEGGDGGSERAEEEAIRQR
jgi:hypothetical protein